MSYKYEIFISYKRHKETLGWIKRHFAPLLEHRVGLALGAEPRIFVHEINQFISAGEHWPQSLGEAIGASKVLIALWTKTFFNSVWCTKEMSLMLARQGERADHQRYGLVIPAIIHDGEDFPAKLQFVQAMDIRSCYNTRMRDDSLKAEELSDLIEIHAEGIASAIRAAPAWNPAWPQAASEELFRTLYRAEPPVQDELPKYESR
jgi:hypothetical protein